MRKWRTVLSGKRDGRGVKAQGKSYLMFDVNCNSSFTFRGNLYFTIYNE